MGDIGRVFDPTQNVLGGIFNPSEPSVPTAPNVNDTINAQREANQVSQFTPQGNKIFGTFGPDGQFIPNQSGQALQITESPFQQQFREGSEGIALGLVDQLQGQQLGGFRSASDVEGGLAPLMGDFAGDAARLEQETFEAGQRRLDPIVQQERRDLIQNLADRGLPLTSEAAQKELTRFDQSVGDRQQDLAFGAIEAGRVEQNRLAQLTAALRGQDVNEQLAFANLEQQQRAQEFGEIGALGGFAAPFQPFNAPTVDVAGIINQGFANQLGSTQLANKQQQAQSAFQGDLLSAGLSAFALSDSRLKENIKYHSTTNSGYKLYDFNYKGKNVTYRGVMAQDILRAKPEAVIAMDSGYYGVRYDKLGLEMEIVDAR